jgi:ATP-dependent protease ClpP protease subunit
MKRLLAAATIILAATSSHAANIKVMHPGCCNPQNGASDVVFIKGEIDEYDYDRFYTAVRGIPPGKAMVVLDSPGGNVKAGLDIGYYIHGYGFTTSVSNGTVCTSMCAAIWLAGKRRFIEAGTFLGFHSTGLRGERSERGNQAMREYYQSIGLRNDTIDVLLSYDPRTVTWLTVEMSKVLGITYEVWKSPLGFDSGQLGRGYHWGEPPPPSDAMPMRPDRITRGRTGGRDDDRGDRGPADYATPRVTEEQTCESQGFTWRDIGPESYCKH